MTGFSPLVAGGASLGGLYQAISDDDASAALAAAWDGGVRAFDTAPHYGVGLSEQRLGSFLSAKHRDAFVVSTKVGRLLVDDPGAVDGTDSFFGTPKRSRVRDYSAAGVRRSHSDSLHRLGLDRVDLLLIHDPDEYVDQAVTQAAPELARMRAEGLIGGFGVGVNHADLALEFVRRTTVDYVMIAGRYSLLDRRAESGLLAACLDRGVSVLVAGVFNSGLLANPDRTALFDYAPAAPALVQAARRMRDACRLRGVALRAAALQFPRRHPAVSAIVSGAGSVATVTDTLEQLRVPIPEELWSELDSLVPEQDSLP